MSSEVKLFRLSGSAPVIDMRTGHNATLRPGLVVMSEDAYTHAIAALEAERERLRAQVSALQSDANSWQSGYDKGREDGAKAADGWKAQHARDSAELRRLCAERDQQWRIRRDVEADRDTANAISSELRAERDALRAELEAIKGQEPVAFYWQDIGYPEPRTHGPYFGQPSESALRNVDGGAIPVLLYTLPAAPEGGEV